MVFGIFWTAIFSVIFFCIGMFFRVIASAIRAWIQIAEPFINFLIFEIIVLICKIAILESYFWEKINSVEIAILMVIALGIYITIMEGVVLVVGGIIKAIYHSFETILKMIFIVVQAGAIFFEDRYIDSMKALVKQVEKQD